MRVVAALLALVVVAGCGGDPEPKEPKSVPTASTTPTATPPTMPAQAKENSPEGAAAFVKHYIDVFNYASNTGDVTELSRLSSPKCDGCQRYIKLFRDTYAAGGYFKDSGWKIVDSKVESDTSAFSITTSIRAPETEYRMKSDGEVKVGEAGHYDLAFELSASHRILALTQVEEKR